MAYNFAFDPELDPIFVDLGNTLGVYRIEQGESPFIALNLTLKDNDILAYIVYKALVAFHQTLPAAYRLFPLVQFYEDLPLTLAEPNSRFLVESQPEIIIIGRARRSWRVAELEPLRFRIVG